MFHRVRVLVLLMGIHVLTKLSALIVVQKRPLIAEAPESSVVLVLLVPQNN
jgi:hypothetical protein